MNSCVLRIYGAHFDVDDYLETSPFRDCMVWHKGEPRRNGYHDNSGFNLDVCEVGLKGLVEQAEKTIEFLRDNFTFLEHVMACPGVENGTLDFSINKRDVSAQFDKFPAELIQLAGSLGFGIELSQYAVSG